MKLVRYGAAGSEKPGLMDADGVLRGVKIGPFSSIEEIIHAIGDASASE
jgi:hypothetical protein